MLLNLNLLSLKRSNLNLLWIKSSKIYQGNKYSRKEGNLMIRYHQMVITRETPRKSTKENATLYTSHVILIPLKVYIGLSLILASWYQMNS